MLKLEHVRIPRLWYCVVVLSCCCCCCCCWCGREEAEVWLQSLLFWFASRCFVFGTWRNFLFWCPEETQDQRLMWFVSMLKLPCVTLTTSVVSPTILEEVANECKRAKRNIIFWDELKYYILTMTSTDEPYTVSKYANVYICNLFIVFQILNQLMLHLSWYPSGL